MTKLLSLCFLDIGESGVIQRIDHPTKSCALSTMCCGVGERITLKHRIAGDVFCLAVEGGNSFCLRKKDASYIYIRVDSL